MKIEIADPQTVYDETPQVQYGDKIAVWCQCAGQPCPQGKVGMQTRCRIWLDKGHLSQMGRQYQKKMNTFDR